MAAVVKLRGLPWSVNEQQIIEFFRPIPVGFESITLINNPDGKPSGEGYVWMHENNIEKAVRNYNKGTIGTRYVEVFESNEAEYTASVQGINFTSGARKPPASGLRRIPAQYASEAVVRVRGLPFDATSLDLVNVLAEYNINEDDVFMGVSTAGIHAGQKNGDAFVRFATVEGAQRCLHEMQGSTVGQRYLDIFSATEAEIEAKANIGALLGYEGNLGKSDTADVNPQENRPGSGWLRLRGLPYAATKHDVITFMGDLPVLECDITIKYGEDGRATGDAYVQLESEHFAQDAKAGLDRKSMGGRFIEVYLSSYEESIASVSKSNVDSRPSPYDQKGDRGGDNKSTAAVPKSSMDYNSRPSPYDQKGDRGGDRKGGGKGKRY